jgi:hypothetical protein
VLLLTPCTGHDAVKFTQQHDVTQVGFLFLVCWLGCVFLPCCTKFNSARDKRAAAAEATGVAATAGQQAMAAALQYLQPKARR